MTKYAIGVDFGTESGRAVLVNVSDGAEIASCVHPYGNKVIDDKLPGANIQLYPELKLSSQFPRTRKFTTSFTSNTCVCMIVLAAAKTM
jgi:ribulose kinase